MSDPRLNSMHLDAIRRTVYRQAREDLLDACGWRTSFVEDFRGMVNAVDWSLFLPFRPNDYLPASKFLLVDLCTNQVHHLETGLNTLGRFTDNDIVVNERYISRRHCVILVHSTGNCEVHDTASMNGTFVNGARVVRPVKVNSGDALQLCDKLLYFFSEEDFRRLIDGQAIGDESVTVTTMF
jgi:hypothetical protein